MPLSMHCCGLCFLRRNFASLLKRNSDETAYSQIGFCLPLRSVWSCICGIQFICPRLSVPEVLLSNLGSLFKVTALEYQLLNQYCLMQPQMVHSCVGHTSNTYQPHFSITVESSCAVSHSKSWFLMTSLDYKCRKCTSISHVQRNQMVTRVQQTQVRQRCVYPKHFQS